MKMHFALKHLYDTYVMCWFTSINTSHTVRGSQHQPLWLSRTCVMLNMWVWCWTCRWCCRSLCWPCAKKAVCLQVVLNMCRWGCMSLCADGAVLFLIAEHLSLPGAVWRIVPVCFHGSDVVGYRIEHEFSLLLKNAAVLYCVVGSHPTLIMTYCGWHHFELTWNTNIKHAGNYMWGPILTQCLSFSGHAF